MTRGRGSLRFLLVAGALMLFSAPGGAQNLGFGGSNDRRPTDIEADNGIEWRQSEQVYIARGNAKASRGASTVYADTLIAHYRPIPNPAKVGAKSADAAAPAEAPPDGAANSGGGSTEIYRVEAEGNVRLTTETQTVYGDHAVYDLDRATAVVTGQHLRLVTPRITVTARDSLEWYDDKQVGVARGDAIAIRDDGRRLAGDILTAQVVKPSGGQARISRIDGQGHVLVSTVNEIARGASGVYNVDSGIATLAGGVTITRGQNVLRGKYAVVDTNNNVSRLLSALPGGSAEPPGAPVEALIVPRSAEKPSSPVAPRATGRQTRPPATQ